MTLTSLLALVLTTCCAVLAVAQFAELGRSAAIIVVLVISGGLILAGDFASRTSLAELNLYVSDPRRRLDLSAVLLLEALLLGNQAIAVAQGQGNIWPRLLGYVPPPSLMITLFLGEVAVMLVVDGADYGVLSLAYAAVCGVLTVTAVLLLRVLLPDPVMRSGLRIMLHAVQAGAGLWLSRPAHELVGMAGPPMLDRLAVVIGSTLIIIALGWTLQRCSILER